MAETNAMQDDMPIVAIQRCFNTNKHTNSQRMDSCAV